MNLLIDSFIIAERDENFFLEKEESLASNSAGMRKVIILDFLIFKAP